MPYKTPLIYTYDCGELEKNMDMAMEMADWHGFAERRKDSEARGKLRGIGMACYVEAAAGAEPPRKKVGRHRGGRRAGRRASHARRVVRGSVGSDRSRAKPATAFTSRDTSGPRARRL